MPPLLRLALFSLGPAILVGLLVQWTAAHQAWAAMLSSIDDWLAAAAPLLQAAGNSLTSAERAAGAGLGGPSPADEVVVVLGYKMFGDGAPSPLLHLRLAAAAAYLFNRPTSDGRLELVLSGGVPPDGPDGPSGRRAPSEAAAMYAHLAACFPTALSSQVQVSLEAAAHSTRTNALNTLR